MGGIIRTRIGALSAAALLGAIALPAAGQLTASAAPLNLYVNNGATAHCSDSGTGLQEQPFCTVSAAAKAVQPGQTVHIAKGAYPEQVDLTKSGTESAPITFETDLLDWQRVLDAGATIGSYTPGGGTARALNIANVQHIRIRNLNLAAVDEGVHVENSTDVSVIAGNVTGAGKAAVRVTGTSDKVTIGRLNLWGSSGVVIDGGAKNTVLTTNMMSTGTGQPSVSVTNAPGTVVVSNSIYDFCQGGIALSGASAGATIENNIIASTSTPGTQSNLCWGNSPAHLKVDATSAVGTKSDYNVLGTVNGETPYDWAGTRYTTVAAFTAAAKQGAYDSLGDPNFPWQGDRHANPLPTVDSADETAPGMLDTDVDGLGFKDDPITPNTGTGSGYRDRGASELQDVGSIYSAVAPRRILDTREPIGVATAGPLTSFLDLKVTGAGDVPATGVTAVTMNVTVTGSTGPGYLTVYPTGTGSSSSNLNWTAGETIANLVTVPVSADGKVTFWERGSGNGVHVIADVQGYYSAKGSIFHSSTPVPVRALDTRNGTGGHPGAVGTGNSVDLQVTGANGVPPTGVTAVTLNVTATDPTSGAFLTVYPHGKDRPTASNLNWTPGKTIANLVTVPVGADGKVSFFVGGAPGTVNLIADVAGYYNGTGHDAYRTYFPERLMDTRQATRSYCDNSTRPAGTIPGHGTLDLAICSPNITGATLNVTVTEPGSAGFLTVYPHGQSRPLSSNLNWSTGETIPNQVVVQVGKDGKVSFYNGGSAPIHLVVDQFGYQGV